MKSVVHCSLTPNNGAVQRLDIYVRPSFKARHRKALIKLAKESKLYPESLVLHDIEVESDAVASGGFGEVHKGKLKGREVAAKMLKVYRDTDMNKLLKVPYL